MKSLLIKDTTVSERAQIVSQALGADSDCEGVDFSDMYDDYKTTRQQNHKIYAL